jgi:adenylosuccinate lyase
MIERYTLPEMGHVWSAENKFARWLTVEIAVCAGWASTGLIPDEDLACIRRASVDLEKMRQYEEETRHDVTAFLRAVSDSLGPESRWVHLGLTSNDVGDTGLSLQIKEASDILKRDLADLEEAIAARAIEHRHTVMVGRTHGVHAEPTTFGFKLAGWVDEVRRARKRLADAADQIAFGKISGAVGTHANVPPIVEERALAELGLQVAPVSTQILQRDRHAHYITTLALVGATLEKMATEIRGLQRTEVHEVEEPFGQGQTGSSAMPHKRNPELSERICGLARVLRGNAVTAMENVALWHERDISNSSSERIIFPESCILLNYSIRLLTRIMTGLKIFPKRMQQNLDMTRGLVFSQRVMLTLIDRGLSRKQAYDLTQRNAMRVWDEDHDFRTLLEADPDVRQHLTDADLDEVFSLAYYLRYVDVAFERVGLGSPVRT